MPDVLALNAVVKRFPGVVAVDGISISFRAGEIVGLVGKNGAGKSTLIKLIAGAQAPDEGTILIDGERVELAHPRAARERGISALHQELMIVPNLTVAENIELGFGFPKRLGLFVNRRRLARDAQIVLEHLDVVLDPRAPGASLSPAQQRLVMLAHALAHRARVVVLDEPTAALTATEIDHLHEIVRSLARGGAGILYVSHRLDEIKSLTQRVVVMSDGRVVLDEPTSAVDRPALVTAIVGASAEGRSTEEAARPARPPRTGDGVAMLEVDGLWRRGAVKPTSFAVAAGEVLGIAGLIGSGRTELLRLLSGADRPSGGRISVRGRAVEGGSPRKAIRAGMVLLPENRRAEGLIADFSIRKNATLPTLRRYRFASWLPVPSVPHERRTARGLVERLAIRARDEESPVQSLSGGNQQKVVLAKWLTTEVNVFLFDEPTQGVDIGGKEEISRLIDDLAAQGKAVVLVASDFSELTRACDRVLVMSGGQVVAELTGADISDGALVRHCYDSAAALV